MSANPVLLTPEEVSDRLRVKTKTLANWRYDPSKPGPKFVRYGRKILYPLTEIEAWENQHVYGSVHDYGRKAA